MAEMASPITPMRTRAVTALGWVVASLCVAASALPLLAIPAMTLGLIVYLAQPTAARRTRLAMLLAAPFVLVALVRFTIEEAVPGIVEGGHRALVTRAIAKLRVLRFSQDIAREQAVWDPDEDGIGSALSLAELVGAEPIRGVRRAPPGLLQPVGSLVETPAGFAVAADGYALIAYVPDRDGKGTARGGPTVDDELAERRWVAYAWPLEEGHGERPVLFIDEHERILVLENRSPGPMYFGLGHPPPYDAGLQSSRIDAEAATDARGQDGGRWRRWKDKEPRTTLPGDRSAPPPAG